MKNPIVKAQWLPFTLRTEEETLRLERAVLQGSIHSSQDIPGNRQDQLSAVRLGYAVAKSAQVRGQLVRLLDVLGELSTSDSRDANEVSMLEELLFLRGFALSRLGRKEEAEECFRRLPNRFHARIQIEHALEKLNAGKLSSAEEIFKRALKSGAETLDPYSSCTLLGGLCLALIHQGKFREANSVLGERKKILKVWPSEPLALGTRLYEILFLLEKNDFDQASEVLARSLSAGDGDSINFYFLSHLNLRLHLARNRLAEAGAIIEQLRAIVRAGRVTEGVLDFRLEEVEWLLRSGQAESAKALIEGIRLEPRRQKDEFFHFRLSSLLAVALMQNREASRALTEVAQAISVGEQGKYRPMLSWTLFHAAGIARAAGEILQAKLYLNRGRKLCEELGLKVRFAAFSYMAEVLDKRYASGSALVSLAKHQEIGPEIEYFLDAYKLLDEVAIAVTQGGRRENFSEPAVRRMLFKESGIFWFQKEAVLLANLGDGEVQLVDMDEKSPIVACFRVLWTQAQTGKKGLPLRSIHKLRSPHTFKSELHEAAAKMLVSRLRRKVAICRLDLRYDRRTAAYSFVSDLPLYTIQSFAAPTRAGEREAEILERIAMEPFVSTRTLCDEFKVTRQALHPTLLKLQRQGKIRVVKRGPVSGYILRSR